MAVEIEWIDSISPAATGNKIYRDTVPSTGEVEIADVPNGTQFYSDATVAEGTQYKFEVQAHDGAGDETTQEVEGENMDYITTADTAVDYFQQDNAAAQSDTNSIGTWLNDGGGRATMTVNSTDYTSGVRSIQGTSHQIAGQYLQITVPGLTIGNNYTFTWDHKFVEVVANPDARIQVWEGLVASPNIDIDQDQTWTSGTWTSEATATSVIMRWYVCDDDHDSTGDHILVDNIKIVDA